MKMTILDIEYALLVAFFTKAELVTFRITKNTRIVNHECDCLIINKAGYLVEFEIKTSLADIKKDLEKKHYHKDNNLRQINFVIPKFLLDKAIEFIPKDFGVWIVNIDYGLKCVRKGKVNKEASPISFEKKMVLFRLDNMKKKLLYEKILKK